MQRSGWITRILCVYILTHFFLFLSQGFSSSQLWYAILDYGTNYCNIKNLVDVRIRHKILSYIILKLCLKTYFKIFSGGWSAGRCKIQWKYQQFSLHAIYIGKLWSLLNASLSYLYQSTFFTYSICSKNLHT